MKKHITLTTLFIACIILFSGCQTTMKDLPKETEDGKRIEYIFVYSMDNAKKQFESTEEVTYELIDHEDVKSWLYATSSDGTKSIDLEGEFTRKPADGDSCIKVELTPSTGLESAALWWSTQGPSRDFSIYKDGFLHFTMKADKETEVSFTMASGGGNYKGGMDMAFGPMNVTTEWQDFYISFNDPDFAWALKPSFNWDWSEITTQGKIAWSYPEEDLTLYIDNAYLSSQPLSQIMPADSPTAAME